MKSTKFTMTIPRSFLVIDFVTTPSNKWKATVRNKNNNKKLAISQEMGEEDITKVCKAILSNYNKTPHKLENIKQLILNTIVCQNSQSS